MPIAKTSIERNNFSRGLITEASALAFPENSAIDMSNIELDRDGSINRRLGFDFESLKADVPTNSTFLSVTNQATSTFTWKNANNTITDSIGVVQIGNKLWFVDLFSDTLSVSLLNGGSSLTVQNDGANISGNEPFQYASVNGILVAVSSELDLPIKLEYDNASDSVSYSSINIDVRDLWGISEPIAANVRPPDLSNAHYYNLVNQGWPTAANVALDQDGDEAAYSNPIIYGRTIVGGYPSNADIFHMCRMEAADDTEAINSYSPWLMLQRVFGNTPAPKGRYILDAFNRGASRTSATLFSFLPSDTEEGNITSVASFANRLFYSGIRSKVSGGDDVSPDYTGTVFFTQTIESNSQLGKCYQSADPTSEADAALVATDGGIIKITGAGTVLKMVPVKSSLVVIAENGVWSISGPDGVFAADDYSITQITAIGCLGGDSVVVAEDIIMFWGDGGIYSLQPDQITGELVAQNITETTIQSLYNDIPDVAKLYVRGNFDPTSRKVKWLYNGDSAFDGTSLKYKYNKELVLDTVLSAFYPNTIEANSAGTFISAYMPVEGFTNVDNVEAVVHNGEQVQVDGEDLVITTPVRSTGDSSVKYLTLTPDEVGDTYSFSFAFYNEGDFKDWGETDASAYIVTGYEFGGDTQRNKQVLYLTAHFNQTETGFEVVDGELEAINPSSCSVQARWDFADSATSGKWGNSFEAYRLRRNYIPTGELDSFDYGYSVVTSKTKVRGNGNNVSFKFSTSPEKDMQLLGWGMIMTGSQDA